MIRLLQAEVNRLRSRRLVLIAVALVFVALALFQLVVASAVSPPSASEVAANRQAYEESRRAWETEHVQAQKECEAQGIPPAECTWPEPTESEFGLAAAPFTEVGPIAVSTTTYLLILTVFLLAASSIGAEYTSGSIANWLTFIPSRWRVYTAKLVVLVGFAAVLSLLAHVFTVAMTALLTSAYGGSLTGLSAISASAGRGVAVAIIPAVVGFVIGLVSRHTVAALGALLAFLFLWFVRAVILGGEAWAARLTPWSPEGNLAAIITNGHSYQVPVEKITNQGVEYEYLERTVSLAQGSIYWLVVLAVLIAGSLLLFRRRDVS